MEPSTQENQQEFFPDLLPPSERKTETKIHGAGRTHKPILFTTTIEQILFACIVAILILCAVYFLGILRGKSLATSVVRVPSPRAVQVRSAAVAAPSPAPVRPPVTRLPAAPVRTAPLPSPAAAAPAAATQRLYTIQVVTHKKRAFAESELAAMTRAGFPGKILESDGYFVVCVGQYTAKEDAKKDLAFLKSKYADCFLRRL